MNTPQDAGQRDLQVNGYWNDLMSELGKLFEAQSELYRRLNRVLRPTGEEKESDQLKVEAGGLCPIAYDFAQNCNIVHNQLNNIQDILDRLEI